MVLQRTQSQSRTVNARRGANGFITFGSFNKLNKITPTVLRMWRQILQRVPTARLVVKAQGLDDELTRRRLIDALGTDETRLRLVGWSDLPSYLALFNDVDVALDSYPFNGGTTSCNAAWMGVPIITLEGETSVCAWERVSCTTWRCLNALRNTEAEYVEIAVRDAMDLHRLRELQDVTHARFQSSALMDRNTFIRDVEAAYRDMWRSYCEAPL